MSFNDPEFGINYIALRIALQKFVKAKRIKKT